MSVLQDPQGPDWPLGQIVVAAAGTPVNIMSLVDPGGVADPANPTAPGVPEYTRRCQQIIFQALKAGTGAGGTGNLINNTGNVYVVRKGAGAGDRGTIVACLAPGATFFLASAPAVTDVFSPYRYYIDADKNADGAQVTLLIF